MQLNNLGLLLITVGENHGLRGDTDQGTGCCELHCECSVVSDSLQPHGLQPTRVLCPWDFPGKNTGVGCHLLFQGSLPNPMIGEVVDSLPGKSVGCPESPPNSHIELVILSTSEVTILGEGAFDKVMKLT